MDKMSRELQKLAKEFGYGKPITLTSTHSLFIHKETGARVVTSATPSDHRALMNIRSDFRRGAKSLQPHPG